MADTISIAGKAVPKNAVYIGGFAAVGILAYAYWKRSSSSGGGNTPTADPNAGLDPSTGLPFSDEFGGGMSYSGLGIYDPATGQTIASYGSQTITSVTTN